MSTRNGSGAVIVLVAAVVALTVASGGVAAQDECQSIDGRQVCVESFSLSHETIVDGQQGEVSVTVENVGNLSATPSVVLSVVDPANETGVYTIGQPTVEPGETATVTQPLNATTVGTHGFLVQLLDDGTRTVYDTSEARTMEVVEEAPPGLGGPIDRVEIALGALVLALFGIGAIAYRLLRD